MHQRHFPVFLAMPLVHLLVEHVRRRMLVPMVSTLKKKDVIILKGKKNI